MLKLLLKYKWYVTAIIILMIIEPTINSGLNFWLQRVFNSAAPGADKIYILQLLTGGFLLWMTKRLVTFAMLVVRDRYICNLKQDVKHGMFVKLFLKNMSNISENASSGEYISMFTNDIMLLEQRFFNQIIGVISGVFSIAILGYSFIALNAKLAGAIIGFGVITLVVPFAFSKNLNAKNTIYSKKIADFTQKLKEYVVAYPTIKNYSIERIITKHFQTLNNDTENAKFEADCSISLANSVGQLIAWFMQFIGVGFGLMLVVKGEIMIGTVIAAQSFASDLALPIQNVVISINSIRSVKSIVKKLEEIADEHPENKFEHRDAEEEKDVLTTGDERAYDVHFNELTLKIDNKTIIDNFSYKFESGKKYLIVGVNGSGKSSLFKVLKKWYKFCSGTITINDRNVEEISNLELSKIISYLNESVSLFSGSVKDNISLFREYDAETLQYAIAQAHMELDLNREIIDEGRNISSGEQRRIEIARTLLKSASVLIFDEVVSTLDIETAYDIEKAAIELPDRTVIFISHNFSGKLVSKYDEIIVMDNGRILEHGTYTELTGKSSYFKKICDIKFGNHSFSGNLGEDK